MIPSNVEQFKNLGAEIEIESGLGENIGVPDSEYESKGATIVKDRKVLLSDADIVVKIRKPVQDDISSMKKGSIHMTIDKIIQKIEKG